MTINTDSEKLKKKLQAMQIDIPYMKGKYISIADCNRIVDAFFAEHGSVMQKMEMHGTTTGRFVNPPKHNIEEKKR